MPVRYYDYIAHNAKRYPNKLAVRDLDGAVVLTYAQFDDDIASLAAYLRHQLKIGRGARVAILAANSAEYLTLLFACGRIGAILVPLNWRLTADELLVIIGDSAPAALFHDAKCRAMAVELRTRGVAVADLELAGSDYKRVVGSVERLEQIAEVHHDDTQIIMYTSGTTGVPKGALLTFGMAFWNCVNLGIPGQITPNTCALCVMPMFHTAGLNVYALPTFHAGGTVILTRAFDAGRVLEIISDPALGVTHFFAVPSAWQFMAHHENFATADFSRIVLAGAGGAVVPVNLLKIYQARGVYIQNGYGMTETSPSVTTLATDDAIRKVGSIGKPLLHTEVKLMKDDDQEAGIDEAGEIWIRGPNVTPGYWRNETANRSAFHNGWLRSGDVGRRDAEGFIFIFDRRIDMYISGGENVYPAEVENVLLQLEGVVATAVIGIPDMRWGQTGLAAICLRSGVTLTQETVLAHCNGRLARFKHPREIVFVDALPLTASGKVHKPTLRAQIGSKFAT